MMENRVIELMAANALVDGGISLPLKTVLREKPFRITIDSYNSFDDPYIGTVSEDRCHCR